MERDDRKIPSCRKAFTLVDVGWIAAIVLIVGLFLVPLFLASRALNDRPVDRENFRRLGVAFNLYKADNNDRATYHLPTLVKSGHASADDCHSPLDLTSEGLGNISAKASTINREVVPWKNSYYSAASGVGLHMIEEFIAKQPSGGWLASIANGKFDPVSDGTHGGTLRDKSTKSFYTGSYLRLGFDGEVMFRSRNNPTGFSSSEFFVDNPRDYLPLKGRP